MPTMTITLADEINAALERVAARNGLSKAQTMRKAFALIVIADREKWKNDGSSLGIICPDQDGGYQVTAKITGL